MWYDRLAATKYEELESFPEVELSPMDSMLSELLKNRRWRTRPLRRNDYYFTPGERYTVDISPHAVGGMEEVSKEGGWYPGYMSDYYIPDLADHEAERSGNLVFNRYHMRPDSGLQDKSPEEENGEFIYRGIHADELESILKTGEINSDSSYNFENQRDVTCFSLDPRQAEHYATGFAPMHAKPSFTHPAYVIKMKMPPPEKIKRINAPEVEVYSPIDASQIVDIYRAKPYAIRGGWIDVEPPDGGHRNYHSGSWSHPISWVGWERAEDKM